MKDNAAMRWLEGGALASTSFRSLRGERVAKDLEGG